MRVKTENMIQKSDGTKIYEPRTIQEVFNDIKKILIEEGLCPDEYFSLSYPMRYVDEAFPEISGLLCNAQWGGSEGIYLDIAMDVFISEENALVVIIVNRKGQNHFHKLVGIFFEILTICILRSRIIAIHIIA